MAMLNYQRVITSIAIIEYVSRNRDILNEARQNCDVKDWTRGKLVKWLYCGKATSLEHRIDNWFYEPPQNLWDNNGPLWHQKMRQHRLPPLQCVVFCSPCCFGRLSMFVRVIILQFVGDMAFNFSASVTFNPPGFVLASMFDLFRGW